MLGDWYSMPGETPFLSDGEEWTYVARYVGLGQYKFGYLRRANGTVYTDYAAGNQEVA